jgi:sorbitol/mannitol transport system permease protein
MAELLRDRSFLGYALASGLTFGALFAYISGSSFALQGIYQTFFTGHEYGQASAAGVVVVIGSIIIGTFALRVVSTLFKEEAR